ncbi:2TM domain-containing protein [Acrocarpospora sp. B8E8]|uniref:2TM domain-containing protein n=1 Tax=Acrocarpospora sp. B8E8 TaxID=3153572 RepID=UPI00325E92C7
MRSTKSESAKKWGLRAHLLAYVLANVAQVIVWWLYDPEHFFWPMWSIVFWGIGLVFHYWGVYSPPKSNTEH